MSRSSSRLAILPTSRSSSDVSMAIPSRRACVKPRPTRRKKVMVWAVCVPSNSMPGWAWGMVSFLASWKLGQVRSMCWEVQSWPQAHLPGGLLGYGSVGVVPDWSWNSARRDAGLYVRSSFGNVVEVWIGKWGSGGCFFLQSLFCCWAAFAWSQQIDTRECLHTTEASVPCFARVSASSLPGMPLWAGVHRPLTVQPSSSSCLMIVRAFRANSEFAGFPIVSVESAAWLSAHMRILLVWGLQAHPVFGVGLPPLHVVLHHTPRAFFPSCRTQ